MKNNFIIFVFCFLFFTVLEARVYKHVTQEKIGQRYYLKHCSSCHGDGNRGGNLDSIMGWEKSYKDNGKELISYISMKKIHKMY